MSGSVVIGLTGSIGMGKSTTAQMFRDEGVPVWDADEAVERIYQRPEVVSRILDLLDNRDGADTIDRDRLREAISRDPTILPRLEKIVHPLVAEDRRSFLNGHSEADLVVLDIPLLFETGGDKIVDKVVVVTAPFDVQRERVLARATMDEEMFEMILSKQIPDAEKRKRADIVIETTSFDETRHAVRDLVDTLRNN